MTSIRNGAGKLGLTGLVAITLALAGCESETPAEAPVEGVVPGIEVTNARLMLPAAEGNPAAVYFDLTYTAERGLSLTGAEVSGAKNTEVHETMEWKHEMTMGEAGPIAMPKGDTVTFEPGGKHIMAFELDDTVKAGSEVDVTLLVSGGDTHIFKAKVLAAGDER